MRFVSSWIFAFLLSFACPQVFGQAAAPGKEAQTADTQGLPPRSSPNDYQAHAQVGSLTIAAEFAEHAVPVTEGALSSDDFVVVETAVFGPPESRLKIAIGDFSLKINGKKPLASQPYGMVFASLKDPQWIPPESKEPKAKAGINANQAAQQGDPPPPRMPMELRVAMTRKVRKAAILEGDRALPQAGLIFFRYFGKSEGIHSVELVYDGPAGKATLELQP
jgi:hypothetical protein